MEPTENNDKTDEFMKMTEATFNFSNSIYIILALYSLEFWAESIISKSAVEGSIPISSTKAYSHKSIISSKPFYVILLF